MAIQSKRNFLGAMRVDLSMMRSIESGVNADFSTFLTKVLTSGDPAVDTYIVRGFGHSALSTSKSVFTITLANSVFLNLDATRCMFVFPDTTEDVRPFIDLDDGTYYFGVKVVESDAAIQQFAFKDSITNIEFNKTVPTAKELVFLETFVDQEGLNEDVVFLYKVTIAGGLVTAVDLADATDNETQYFLTLAGDSYNSLTEWAEAINIIVTAAADKTVGGDLSGTYPDATVIAIQNNPVQSGTLGLPDAGKVLGWTGAEYALVSVQGGSGGGGIVFYFNNTGGDAPAPASSNQASAQFDEDAGWDTGAITVPNSTTPATLATFVTDVDQPSASVWPAGIWELNIYAQSDAASEETAIRFKIGKWDGSTVTTLATSDYAYITNPGVTTQYTLSTYLAAQDVALTDRLVITLEGRRFVSSAHDVTLYFGSNAISHVHTPINALGGTGLMKVFDGYMQPASLLVDADVDAAAAIARSKLASGTANHVVINDGTGVMSSEAQLAVSRGGTGASTLTDHGVLVGSGTAAVDALAVGTNGQILVGQTGADPQFKTMSGDATLSSTGVLTLGTVPASKGGTGLTSPGTSGNVLTSDGTGWISSPITTQIRYASLTRTSNLTFTNNYAVVGWDTQQVSGGISYNSGTGELSIPAGTYQYTLNGVGELYETSGGNAATYATFIINPSVGSNVTLCQSPVIPSVPIGSGASVLFHASGIFTIASTGTITIETTQDDTGTFSCHFAGAADPRADAFNGSPLRFTIVQMS